MWKESKASVITMKTNTNSLTRLSENGTDSCNQKKMEWIRKFKEASKSTNRPKITK